MDNPKETNSVLQIREWLNEAHAEVSNIEARIKPELEKLEKYKKKINLYQQLLEIEEPVLKENKSVRILRRLKQFTGNPKIADLAYNVLKEAQGSLHYTEIMGKIEAQGVEIPGENKKANMTAHLANDERIVRADERGFYKLKE